MNLSPLSQLKAAMQQAASLSASLDNEDPAQRRACVKVLEAAAAVAKLRAPKVDQPDLPGVDAKPAPRGKAG